MFFREGVLSESARDTFLPGPDHLSRGRLFWAGSPEKRSDGIPCLQERFPHSISREAFARGLSDLAPRRWKDRPRLDLHRHRIEPFLAA